MDLTPATLPGGRATDMDRDEALRLLRGGPEGVKEWNRRREAVKAIPSFIGVHLIGADLGNADLYRAKLSDANLSKANLCCANLCRADLRGANLGAANLSDANLSCADLHHTDFRGANLSSVDLTDAECWFTVFADVDLTTIKGIYSVDHDGPSDINIGTLFRSRGQIPEAFLRGCGLTPWEVLMAKAYDPALSPPQFAELQYRIFDAWTKGRTMINGCFISYSHADAKFVEKLRNRLIAEGVNVWLDRHDMVAGTIQDQVWLAIQVHHVALLVLSETSVQSDWVENELDMARAKERNEKRAVLCPVALDDAWKAKVDAKGSPGDPSRALWRTLTQKLVVDFSGWKTEAFDEAFQKLVRGLKVNYGPGAHRVNPMISKP
jgi:hypothetical protein